MFETVIEQSGRKILLVTHKESWLASSVYSYLRKYGEIVDRGTALPEDSSQYDRAFIFSRTRRQFSAIPLNSIPKKSVLFVPISTAAPPQLPDSMKLVKVDPDALLTEEQIAHVMWFVMSSSGEQVLTLHTTHTVMQDKPSEKKKWSFPKKRRFYVWVGIALFLIVHGSFVPFIGGGLVLLYQSAEEVRAGRWEAATAKADQAKSILQYGEQLYNITRPSYRFFSLSPLPENAFDIAATTHKLITNTIPLKERITKLLFAITDRGDTSSPDEIRREINALITETATISTELQQLSEKLPRWELTQEVRREIAEARTMLDIGKQILPLAVPLLEGEKRYLFLFANNMELRPGGGFIGSFAIADVDTFRLRSFTVYDVYDADGQLKAHIEPPAPIEKYLKQPHWFLRDSAFSPDFIKNYEQAKLFVGKQLNIGNFSGAALITTTAVQNIISAYESLYIPEYRETITKDNFYIKAQTYAEQDFFPGSIRKKHFLSSVANQIMINFDTVDPVLFVRQIKKSLEEKMAVVYLENAEAQQVFDGLYWSGRVLQPVCTVRNSACTTDYFFPYDANLGVNKANFFVTRSVRMIMSVKPDGTVTHQVRTLFRNDSVPDTFPGGVYRNYFQTQIPAGSSIQEITINNSLVEEYDVSDELYRTVGFMVSVPAQSEAEVKIIYTPPAKIPAGKSAYQMIVQKQIGAGNYDFSLDIGLPDSIFITNQNFRPLVKEKRLVYNTSISSDKIFLLELIRE